MRVIVFQTPEERTKGLIGMKPIPECTLFVFPEMHPGVEFHSRGVLEPFEIHFLDAKGCYISGAVVYPPDGTIKAPPGTRTIVESKIGTLQTLGRRALEEILR